MTGAQFGSFLLGVVVVAIVVAIGVWLLHWLYLRSSKERSFVRTGLGGQKVVLDGGKSKVSVRLDPETPAKKPPIRVYKPKVPKEKPKDKSNDIVSPWK